MSQLATDQRWLVRAIASPRPPPADARLDNTAITAAAGLAIYRHAYRARLVECLADDFPALQGLLGIAAFTGLAETVIGSHPPQAATLNRYGLALVRHLRCTPGATMLGRLALDVARLEWALVEAIHAPLAPSLGSSELAGLAPSRWAGLRLCPAPSLRHIASRWPIDLVYVRHLRGETPSLPAAQPESVFVLRRDDGLHRLALEPARGRLVAALARGRPLGKAVAASGLSPEALRNTLAAAVAAGCFRSIRMDVS